MKEFLQSRYKDGVMDLYNCKLTSFPMELLEYKEMKILYLTDNKLTSIPKEIGQLINLKELYLHYNILTSIPKEIGQLINLQELWLFANKLVSIPPEIGQLVNLKILDFNENQLTSIPKELGQLINLQELSLYSNKLTSIPKEIGQLVTLKELHLSNNQLTSIPPEIRQLINLQMLYLSDNQLTSIPPEIGQLVNLQELYFHYNELTSIPTELGQLRNLRELWSSSNQLRSIPIELGQLRNIQCLLLHDNPINYFPPPVQRLLDRLIQGQKVYQDKQSIHNSSIQKSFRESVNKLLSKRPILSLERTLEEIVNSELSDICKSSLVDYSSSKDIHGELNITFGDLLLAVWDRIRTHENKQDIYKILSQEMSDALCMCFTGRITRLVNTLSGFVPEVIMHISDNEQISNLVLLTKDKINPYNSDEHKALFQKEMQERGYSQDIINEWLSYL